MRMQIEKNRHELKMTVLHRKGRTWHQTEVGKFATNLMTEVSQHPKHPEYLVL